MELRYLGVGDTELLPLIYFWTSMYCVHRSYCMLIHTEYSKTVWKLAHWALVIQEMDLTIKHKSGKKITNTDALSHCTTDESRLSFVEQEGSKCSDLLNSEISNCQTEDETCQF